MPQIKRRLLKLLRHPVSTLRRRLKLHLAPYKYRAGNGYDARRYWADRLAEHGCKLSGVGIDGLDHEENLRMYTEARETFLSLCRAEGVDFKNVRVLDVGSGNGFYAQALADNGVTRYLGIDITDALFSRLQPRFPGFAFRKLDIASEEMEGTFELIIMIDVTQHIVEDMKFAFAMRNIRQCLSARGVFIVTSWLSEKKCSRFYEIARTMAKYRREFPGHLISKPAPFRGKYIFSIRQMNVGART